MDFAVPKRLWRKGLQSVVKYVTMMMRKRASMKRLDFYSERSKLFDYQFSCSSTPVNEQSFQNSKWASLRSLLTGCINSREIRTLSLSFPRFSIENGPNFSSESGDHMEVDREAEEFIAKFYEEMELQRQDSFLKWQEMLARGT